MVNVFIKKIAKQCVLVTLCSASLLGLTLAQTPQGTISSQSPSTSLQEVATVEKTTPVLSEKLNKERLLALPDLKTKLEQLQKRNRADLSLIFNEKLFSNLLTELTKSKFNLGNIFDVTVVNPHMVFVNGLALAQLQAQLTSTNSLISVTTSLNITARLLVEQDEKDALFAKFQIVDVQNPNSSTSSTPLPSTLSADQLEKLLPPVKLPLELDFDRLIAADKYSQTKPVAYEISTEARRIRGKFKIIDLLPLNNRLVLLAKVQDLSISQGQIDTKPKSKPPVPKLSPASFLQQNTDSTTTINVAELDKQIDELSAKLVSKTDFSIIVKRYFLDTLADQLAQVSVRDVVIKLLPCRVMSSKSDLGFAKYENYLDIENGDGTLDLRDAEVQEIKNGQISLYVDASGQIQAQAKGKQLNFDYRANPQISVNLQDKIAFTVEQSGQDFLLKPVPKKITVHLDIKVPLQMIGKDVSTSQNVPVDVASVVKPIVLPKLISTNFSLPKETQVITLADVNYKADNNELLFGANLTFTSKEASKEASKNPIKDDAKDASKESTKDIPKEQK